MRTAQEYPPTKEKMLEAAEKLVLGKGFVGTTVDDICEKAGVTKGSFFHYFESKDELGRELLERYCANSKEAFFAGCCREEKDPLKRVFGFLDFMIKMAKEKGKTGCLVGSMAQELADTNSAIRSICAKAFTEMAENLKKDLVEAKIKYAPKSKINPQSLADHFVAVLESGMLVAKVRRDSNTMASSLSHFKEYLKPLFNV